MISPNSQNKIRSNINTTSRKSLPESTKNIKEILNKIESQSNLLVKVRESGVSDLTQKESSAGHSAKVLAYLSSQILTLLSIIRTAHISLCISSSVLELSLSVIILFKTQMKEHWTHLKN